MGYRIGSFNVQRLGNGATNEKITGICDIIREENLDIVAFQEAFSEGKGFRKKGFELGLPGWDFFFQESANMPGNHGEGYVFGWNTKRFCYSESRVLSSKLFQPRVIGLSGNDGIHLDGSWMARPPMYGRFRPVNGGFFEIRLINIHVVQGGEDDDSINSRKKEYEYLIDEIFPKICDKRFGNNRTSYTIAMGDYNLALLTPNNLKSEFFNPRLCISDDLQGRLRVKTVLDEPTTLRSSKPEDKNTWGYRNNFDHFTFSEKDIGWKGGRCTYNRIDAVEKYFNNRFDIYHRDISDHVPILLELDIMEEIAYDNNGYRKAN